MTNSVGEFRDKTASELQKLALKSSNETIWPLSGTFWVNGPG